MSQETKRSAVCGVWPLVSVEPCLDCGARFDNIPAFIMVPSSHLGIYGNYCSWNCAKRALLRVRTRRWFSLMAITAIRTGAKLPIRIFQDKKDCIPLFVPQSLRNVIYVSNIHIQEPPPLKTIEEEEEEPTPFSDVLPIIK